MGNPWDVRAAEWVGKALPNEVTKLNSYSKYIEKIPYVGQALSGIIKGMSAMDAGTTAYADTYKEDARRGDSEANRRIVGAQRLMQGVKAGVGGTSQDPGIYGSQGDINRDWANIAGQIGNYLPSWGKSEGGGTNVQMGANPIGAINNPYFNDEEYVKPDTNHANEPVGYFSTGTHDNPYLNSGVEQVGSSPEYINQSPMVIFDNPLTFG